MFKSLLKGLFGRQPAGSPSRPARATPGPSPEAAALTDAARDIGMRLRMVSDMTYGVTIANCIRLVDFDLETHPRYGDPKRLLRYAFQVNSQNGEDGMIHEIFRRIGVRDRVFAEIGVGDGRECNTAFLLALGWTGFWVDGNDLFLGALKDRPDLGNGCLKHEVAHVSRENVAAIFRKLEVPREFDLLSLDIDQNTYYLWEGLKDFRPRVVVVEYNSALPPDVEWKVHYDPERNWDSTQNFGASLRAFELLGEKFGYSLVGCNFTGVNAFFVRSDLVGDHFAAPPSSENHYEPPRYHFTIRRCHPAAILDRGASAEKGPSPAR